MSEIQNPAGLKLWQMRKMLGLAEDHPVGDTVLRWYEDAFARSVRMRGHVGENIVAEAHKNLIELGKFSSGEADDWCFCTNERCTQYAAQLRTAHRVKPGERTPQQQWWHDYQKRNEKPAPKEAVRA